MIHDTYGEEYIEFLQDLNDLLMIHSVKEVDFM